MTIMAITVFMGFHDQARHYLDGRSGARLR